MYFDNYSISTNPEWKLCDFGRQRTKQEWQDYLTDKHIQIFYSINSTIFLAVHSETGQHFRFQLQYNKVIDQNQQQSYLQQYYVPMYIYSSEEGEILKKIVSSNRPETQYYVSGYFCGNEDEQLCMLQVQPYFDYKSNIMFELCPQEFRYQSELNYYLQDSLLRASPALSIERWIYLIQKIQNEWLNNLFFMSVEIDIEENKITFVDEDDNFVQLSFLINPIQDRVILKVHNYKNAQFLGWFRQQMEYQLFQKSYDFKLRDYLPIDLKNINHNNLPQNQEIFNNYIYEIYRKCKQFNIGYLFETPSIEEMELAKTNQLYEKQRYIKWNYPLLDYQNFQKELKKQKTQEVKDLIKSLRIIQQGAQFSLQNKNYYRILDNYYNLFDNFRFENSWNTNIFGIKYRYHQLYLQQQDFNNSLKELIESVDIDQSEIYAPKGYKLKNMDNLIENTEE